MHKVRLTQKNRARLVQMVRKLQDIAEQTSDEEIRYELTDVMSKLIRVMIVARLRATRVADPTE